MMKAAALYRNGRHIVTTTRELYASEGDLLCYDGQYYRVMQDGQYEISPAQLAWDIMDCYLRKVDHR